MSAREIAGPQVTATGDCVRRSRHRRCALRYNARLPPKAKVLTGALSQNPPRTLYHYTTQSGLLGIIQSGEIWATHTQYLNDQKEYRHATELVASIIAQRLQDADPAARAILNDMLSGIQGI